MPLVAIISIICAGLTIIGCCISIMTMPLGFSTKATRPCVVITFVLGAISIMTFVCTLLM